MLVVKELTVRYPGREDPAFRRVDFDLPDGAILLVCGDSGSGKTTLALALSGVLQQACPEAEISGSVLWNGRPPDWQAHPSIAVTLENPYAQLTGIKGTVDGTDSLNVLNCPIAILSAHGPTPESKHRDRKSRPSEGPTFHRNLLFLPSAIPLRE